ncbi:MAG: DUF2283 domain-containing protein [Bacteroidetes bacterium]|nr:DUF2283 domain-containing protein [Bacteroidota bacterium]
MNFNYDDKTDTLYINFIDEPGVDSFEIAQDYIVDVDSTGRVLGIEVLNVKKKFNFDSIVFKSFPLKDVRFIGQTSA